MKDKMVCPDWCKGLVITMVDTLDVSFNMDLDASLFYILMNEKVFSIKSEFIKGFILDNKSFINYKRVDEASFMLLELLVPGEITLYKHHELIYKKPDFDPILNVGSRTGSYKKKYSHFGFCNDRLFEVSSKIKKARKKIKQECSIEPKQIKKGTIIELFESLKNPE